MEKEALEARALHATNLILVSVSKALDALDREISSYLSPSADQASLTQVLPKLTTRLQSIRTETRTALFVLATQLNGPSEITADLRAWATQQFTEEEIAAGIREIRATGGVELSEFISDLEQAAAHE